MNSLHTLVEFNSLYADIFQLVSEISLFSDYLISVCMCELANSTKHARHAYLVADVLQNKEADLKLSKECKSTSMRR